MAGLLFTATSYSIEPIFAVPADTIRFCDVTALVTSCGEMPRA